MNRRNGKSKQVPAGRFLSIRRQREKCWTLICAEALIAAHVMLLLPAPVQAVTPAPPAEPVSALSALLFVTSQGQSPGRSQEVQPKREVPDVEPPPLYPVFSLEPTDEELFRARVFREPLAPMDMEPERNENRALADAIIAYLAGGDTEDFRPWMVFFNRFPESRWRASLLTNLGIVYRKSGFLSRARAAFEEAWGLAKESEDPHVKRVADLAITEVLDMYGQFGDVENLERLLSQVEGREMEGATAEKRWKAETTVWGLKNVHEMAIPSGSIAVERLFFMEFPEEKRHPEIENFPATMEGAALNEIEDLANRVGLGLQRAYRQNKNQAPIPVPSLAHFKGGHFTAVVEERNGRYRLDDPLLGGEIWMSREAFEEESTGYFLIAGGNLPPGWRMPSLPEVAGVKGKCALAQPGESGTGTEASKKGGCAPCRSGGTGGSMGMADYAFHEVLVSLNITDNPVGYDPPVGPSVRFWITYNQREAVQPQTFTFSNLGQLWTHDWLAYVEDDPSNLGEPVDLILRGGGSERYRDFENNVSAPQLESRAVLAITSTNPIEYERRLPDGSIEIYAQPDGAATAPRKVFLTEYQDPQGNAVTLTYDAQLRLVSVTDAIGQVTTLSYEETTNPLLITKVTDPFSRSATIEYDENGKLVAINDVIGMSSEFTYGTAKFIRSMTTPYGTTTFRHGTGVYGQSINKFLEATDPLGGTERVEFILPANSILPTEDAEADVPTGFVGNSNLNSHFSVYFDKLAMDRGALGDPTDGVVTKWLMTDIWTISTHHKLAEKKALENRVWYNYAGNQAADQVGPLGRPSKIGRVLDDGSSQIYRYEYNSRGHVTRFTDPVSRETVFEYDTNDIDLLSVKQKSPESPTGYDLLATYTYNSQHLPLTKTDAAGQTTTYTYNSEGQLATVTTPERAGITEDRTTTYTYDEDGYLESVEQPLDATTSYTYDSYGRVDTVTDPDNYVLTYDYDGLDRLTKVTYPDSTFEETVYERLDPVRFRDRLGRWTHQAYDALRRLTTTTDLLGRSVTQQWCNCGSFEALVDAMGNRTEWERDIQGRVTKEIRATGSEWLYEYEDTTDRIKTVTDPKEQVKTHTYFLDDNLKDVTYSNEEHDTPDISLAYDTTFNRLTTIVDGTGTTTYAYHPIGTSPPLGAGNLVSVDGPLSNDTITYTYDELGRVVSRAINSVALTYEYDAIGRVSEENNALGTFSYEYDGVTDRLDTVDYPNGQTSSYSYFGNSGDHRLEQIHHRKPDASTISKFNYTYDAVGNIKSWTQQQDANPPKAYDFEYDQASQLRTAVWRTTDPTPTILKRYAYTYDPAGNRTVEQIDDAPVLSAYDSMNRLTGETSGGAMRFAGTLNEAATVTIQAVPATVTADNSFAGTATVSSGTSQVVVKGIDYSGNERTNTYEVTLSSVAETFTFDANGNMTSDGTRTFEWDAENRLIAVEEGTSRYEFFYDGTDNLTRAVERDNDVVVEDQRYVWCGISICEELNAAGSAVTKRYFDLGVQDGSNAIFYTTDHLGSVRELTDVAVAVRTRYDYTPFGEPTKLFGDLEVDARYTGHHWHQPTGLTVTARRFLDPTLGRWLSEDPLGREVDSNFYVYAFNNPISYIDPDGERPKKDKKKYQRTDKKKGYEERQKSGERERNVRGPKGEEHSRRDKNWRGPRRMGGKLGGKACLVGGWIWDVLQEMCRAGLYQGLGCLPENECACVIA